MRNTTLLVVMWLFTTVLLAQHPTWSLTSNDLQNEITPRNITPNEWLTYEVSLNDWLDYLQQAPHERQVSSLTEGLLVQIPNPDGELESFHVVAYDLLPATLQTRWSDLYTWRGVSTRNPQVTIRLDHTAHGFHAMVFNGPDTWYIDPLYQGNLTNYQTYYKRHYPQQDVEQCLYTEFSEQHYTNEAVSTARTGDCQLREYRLALACTGEYAVFHGGTEALAAAAMATTLNRVNGIFEAELAIRLVLIPNNYLLVYLYDGSDPFTNGDLQSMLTENQFNTDLLIGPSNYDIGHVFGTGSNTGAASLQSVCTSSSKARGVSLNLSPTGDPYDVDFVAHEMGHQFGANHTQNNNCNRRETSVEPGSGSTIMGYAGICFPNVQTNSDAYFNGINLEEIANYMELGTGNVCGTVVNTSNNTPEIVAVPDYHIPRGTPFVLTGTASDPEGHTLSYCWEQMDAEISEATPPLSTNTQGPNFRSMPPTAEQQRYFPNLNDLTANISPTWETLPVVERALNFRLTVRDYSGLYGCNTFDDMTVNVVNDGSSFVVQEPTAATTALECSTLEVQWNVANTDEAPINCNSVDIFLSTDSGLSFPTLLASDTPNDGLQTVQLPPGTSSSARIMVRSKNNIFFAISTGDFQITSNSTPDYAIAFNQYFAEECVDNAGTTDLRIDSYSIKDFEDPVALILTNTPAGVSGEFSANPILPGQEVTLTLTNLQALSTGIYSIGVRFASSTGIKDLVLPLYITNVPPAPSLTAPLDEAQEIRLFPVIAWTEVPTADNYLLEITTDPSFNSNITTVMQPGASYIPPTALHGNTTYYWRVTAIGDLCISNNTSLTRSFTTEKCYFFSNNEVVNIADGAPDIYYSVINIPNAGNVQDLDLVGLTIDHSWVSDIEVSLTSPANTTVDLFSDLCSDADNILVSLDDEGSGSLDCPLDDNETAPPINGNLSTFDLESMQGDWTLTVRDDANLEGGRLLSWNLKICSENFGALPVEWLNFKAIPSANTIDLYWQTTAEEDNAGFRVERRSTAQSNFTDIGWVEGAKAPAEVNHYTFVDNTALPGITYFYRLQQLDHDGQYDYSDIVTARLSSPDPQWASYPNPVDKTLHLDLWNTTEAVKIQIHNATGQLIHSTTADTGTQPIDCSKLPAGTYWLRLQQGEWSATQKVTKL